jgi:hypothetical protein
MLQKGAGFFYADQAMASWRSLEIVTCYCYNDFAIIRQALLASQTGEMQHWLSKLSIDHLSRRRHQKWLAKFGVWGCRQAAFCIDSLSARLGT